MPGRGGLAVNPDFEDLLRCLNRAKVRYLVVGAYAVVHYTEPRYTKDIDIWIDATPRNAARVYRALAAFGAPLESVTVEDFSTAGLVYQIGIEPNRIDILMSVGGTSFSKAWHNRTIATYGRVRVPVLGIRELITTKQAANRSQDRQDLRSLERTLTLFGKRRRTQRRTQKA